MESRSESGGGHFQNVPAAPARLQSSLGSQHSQGSGYDLSRGLDLPSPEVWICLAPETTLDSARDKQWSVWGGVSVRDT